MLHAVHAYHKVMDALNSTTLQTLLYIVFVVVFQLISGAVRVPQEFYLDKHVMDRIVENHFDSSHNTFESIRRIADVYEWGNTVLIPGLFADMGPCNSETGLPHTGRAKGCNDDAVSRPSPAPPPPPPAPAPAPRPPAPPPRGYLTAV